MMKKWVTGFLVISSSLLLLAGCGSSDQPTANSSSTETTVSSSQAETISVTINIENQGEQTDSKTLEVTEDTPLLTMLEDNFTVEAADGFIESIDGVTQDADQGLYWTFTINGDWGESSAAETFLTEGDEVVFSYGGV